MAEDYLTVAELASTLTLDQTFADADMAQAITAASRDVERRTGRRFWRDTGTRYYTPGDSLTVWTDDLVSVSAVRLDLGMDGTFGTTLDASDYVLEPANATADSRPYTELVLMPRSTRYFPVGFRSVRIDGTFGWSAVPSEVKQATGILAARFMKRAREAPFGVAGFGIDGGAIRVSSFDPDVDALLAGLVRTNFC